MFTMDRPTVLLPQPDSPTRPSVSPLRRSKLTPSTARTSATFRANTPPVTGNRTNRSCTSSSFSILGLWRIHEVASHPVPRGILNQFGFDLVARFKALRASRDELAGWRQIQNARNIARDGAESAVLVAVNGGERCQQAPRVGMQRILEKLFYRRDFLNFSAVHDHNALAGFGDNRQVVCD